LYVNKNLSVYKSWKKDIPGNIEGQWPSIERVAAGEL